MMGNCILLPSLYTWWSWLMWLFAEHPLFPLSVVHRERCIDCHTSKRFIVVVSCSFSQDLSSFTTLFPPHLLNKLFLSFTSNCLSEDARSAGLRLIPICMLYGSSSLLLLTYLLTNWLIWSEQLLYVDLNGICQICNHTINKNMEIGIALLKDVTFNMLFLDCMRSSIQWHKLNYSLYFRCALKKTQ